jgi:hypothetical protein
LNAVAPIRIDPTPHQNAERKRRGRPLKQRRAGCSDKRAEAVGAVLEDGVVAGRPARRGVRF